MDRNVVGDVMGKALAESLSARRAWIEMEITGASRLALDVALRKESVDRNLCYHYSFKLFKVALRKESVDRN